MLWGKLVNCCGEIILSNNKYSFKYRELIYLKKNLAGLFGLYLYSIFFSTSLNASSYNWECKKNRSYLIEDGELFDTNSRIKKFPTKFISTLNENSKVINVTYSLETGKATINGNSGIVSGFSEVKDLEKMSYKPVVIFFKYDDLRDTEKRTQLNDNDAKKLSVKTELSTILEEARNNFVLNIRYNTAKFVFTELTKIQHSQSTLEENNIYSNDTLNIKELIEVSSGECRQLNNKIN